MYLLKIHCLELSPEVWKIDIEGTVDPTNISILKNAIDGIFNKGIYKLVLDLKGAEYISSTGIGCFITSLDVATEHAGQILFIAAPPQIQRIADILMLSEVFTFVDDEKSALELLEGRGS